MTQKETDKETGINRRKLLQATGVAAGSLMGMKNVSAQEIRQSAEKISEVEFVEVLMEHKDTPNYPIAKADKFARYRVEEDTLLLSGFVDENDAYGLVKNDKVINSNGRHGTPQSGIPSGRRNDAGRRNNSGPGDKSLTISTGVDGRPSSILQLEEPYSSPSPNLKRMDNNGVSIEANGVEVTVPRRSEDKAELPNQEIMVREKSDSFRTIKDPRIGEERKIRERGKTKSVEVTPEVTVKNHGRIGVYKERGE